MKKEIKAFSRNVFVPAIDIFIDSLPIKYQAMKVAWLVFKNACGFYLELFQDEAKEFMENVKNNIDAIGGELFNSKEFSQGLLITLENLARVRSEEKRKFVKQIFINGFMYSNDLKNYELERMYAILNQMSIEQLVILKEFESKSMRIQGDDQMYFSLSQLNQNYSFEYLDEISALTGLGILSKDIRSKLGKNEWYRITKFGNDFLKFLI